MARTTSAPAPLRYTFPFDAAVSRPYRRTMTFVRFPASAWESYDEVAPLVRAAAGVERLTPSQARAVRASVALHNERAARRPAAYAPVAGLREQIRSETQDAVRRAMGSLYRVYSLDGLSVSIDAAPGVSASTSTKWVSGRGGFGHVTDGQSIRLRVCPSWRRRVEEEGLAVVDGLLTTHADPAIAYRWSSRTGWSADPSVVSPDWESPVDVYRAAWVRQGRGYDLNIERGWIARHRETGATYHSARPDAIDAVRGLRRKLGAQHTPSALRDEAKARRAARAAEKKARQVEGLVNRLAKWDLSEVAHVEITRADSLRAGNCEPGTDEFIERVMPGRTEATIGELAERLGRVDLPSLARADLTLARQLAAACLHAIRRDKSARRLVLA